jgi:hypothetical protein
MRRLTPLVLVLMTPFLAGPATAQADAAATAHGKRFVCTVELESGREQLLGGPIVESVGMSTVNLDSVDACTKWGKDAYDTKAGFVGYVLLVHDRGGALVLKRTCTAPLAGPMKPSSCKDER